MAKQTRSRETAKRLAIAAGLAIVSSACDDGRRSSPAGPSSSEPLPPTFTLSGVISVALSAGPEPVEGAVVEDIDTHQRATTDKAGLYSIPGMSAKAHVISATKYGLVTESRPVTINADTRVDIQFRQPYAVTGVVFETTSTGRAPIRDVDLYCDACGPDGHTRVFSAADGSFRFDWVPAGRHAIIVSSNTYRLPASQPIGSLEATDVDVSGNTRFDIELVRR
jgi:hypothetical protein